MGGAVCSMLGRFSHVFENMDSHTQGWNMSLLSSFSGVHLRNGNVCYVVAVPAKYVPFVRTAAGYSTITCAAAACNARLGPRAPQSEVWYAPAFSMHETMDRMWGGLEEGCVSVPSA